MKEYFERLEMGALHHDEWFQMMAEFWAAVRNLGAETLKVETFWDPAFIENYHDADEAQRTITKSDLSDKLVELDSVRDEMYRSLKANVKSFTTFYEVAKRDAAKRLWIIFKTYGNVPMENYPAETSDIYNLLQELRLPKYSADVAALSLNAWMIELDKANKEFENVYVERAEKMSEAKPKKTMYEARKDLDAVYEDVLCCMEAHIFLEGMENYKAFVEKWNYIVKKYETIIAQRKGRAEAKKNDPSVIASGSEASQNNKE